MAVRRRSRISPTKSSMCNGAPMTVSGSLSHAKSDRGEIDHIPANSLKLADAVTVVPPMKGSMEGTGGEGDAKRFLAGEHELYVTVIEGGPEEILKFDLQGKSEGKVPVPEVASVSALVPLTGDSFLIGRARTPSRRSGFATTVRAPRKHCRSVM